jgi:hypothetical protein
MDVFQQKKKLSEIEKKLIRLPGTLLCSCNETFRIESWEETIQNMNINKQQKNFTRIKILLKQIENGSNY